MFYNFLIQFVKIKTHINLKIVSQNVIGTDIREIRHTKIFGLKLKQTSCINQENVYIKRELQNDVFKMAKIHLVFTF